MLQCCLILSYNAVMRCPFKVILVLTILWSSSTSIVSRHYLDCLICRYHLTIFTTQLLPGKKAILSFSKNTKNNGRKNGGKWEEKWRNNRQQQKWQPAKHLLSGQLRFFALEISFLSEPNTVEDPAHFRRENVGIFWCYEEDNTMEGTPRCTGTKQRSRPGRDHSITKKLQKIY